MMTARPLVSAFVILAAVAILNLLTACNAAPEPQPASPAPVSRPSVTDTPAQIKPATEEDIPKISAGEMAAFLWDKLPEQLINEYKKSQFLSPIKKATYQGNGKWVFQTSGTSLKSTLLPTRNYEKSPGYWVESHTQEVTTGTLLLTANYYEKTDTLEILSIEKSNEATKIETLFEKKIIGEGLKVSWINASTTGLNVRVECSVKNIGIIPLEEVSMQVTLYDAKGLLIRTDNVTMVPGKINVGENAKFNLFILLTNQMVPSQGSPGQTPTFGKYDYRFFLRSGKEIYFERPDGSSYSPGTSPSA
jgi:hypothetical protein